MIRKRLLYALQRCRFLFIKKRGRGWAVFAPMHIPPEYIKRDGKTVIAVIRHNGVTHLTISVDKGTGRVQTKGNLRKIARLTYPFTKRRYIELIRTEAAAMRGNETEYVARKGEDDDSQGHHDSRNSF